MIIHANIFSDVLEFCGRAKMKKQTVEEDEETEETEEEYRVDEENCNI